MIVAGGAKTVRMSLSRTGFDEPLPPAPGQFEKRTPRLFNSAQTSARATLIFRG
jgi:hypothetical protein